jgi:K+-transporting ATPase ATPase A chain
VPYVCTPTSNTNGSAFAGLSANTFWYDIALGLVTLMGWYLPIILVLAPAGSLARQGHIRSCSALCRAAAVILCALSFLRPLALGPLAEGIH